MDQKGDDEDNEEDDSDDEEEIVPKNSEQSKKERAAEENDIQKVAAQNEAATAPQKKSHQPNIAAPAPVDGKANSEANKTAKKGHLLLKRNSLLPFMPASNV